jgi:hypothetical protein
VEIEVRIIGEVHLGGQRRVTVRDHLEVDMLGAQLSSVGTERIVGREVW